MPPGVKAAMIDCSVQNMGAGDILEAIKIPAGSIIVEVGISILVAEGGTATADVGFTGDGQMDSLMELILTQQSVLHIIA